MSTTEETALPPASHDERLLRALQAMTEVQLTRQIVLPLISKLYPRSLIEESHGSNEAGRDIVCVSNHPTLRRQHVLVVQVKAHPISPGSTAGPYSLVSLVNQLEAARRIGVSLPNGELAPPDEVWLISSYPFTEPNRRLARDYLVDLRALHAHLIDGVELLDLLTTKAPEIISELTSWTDHRIAQAILSLSVHHESRAFGLRADRALADFHVSARVCPGGAFAQMLFSRDLAVCPLTYPISWQLSAAAAQAVPKKGTGIVPSDLKRDREFAGYAKTLQAFGIEAAWVSVVGPVLPHFRVRRRYRFERAPTFLGRRVLRPPLTRDSLEVVFEVQERNFTPSEMQGDYFVPEDLDRSPTLASIAAEYSPYSGIIVSWTLSVNPLKADPKSSAVNRSYTFDLRLGARKRVTDLKALLKSLPERLQSDPPLVAKALAHVQEAEQYIRYCRELGCVRRATPSNSTQPPVVLVTDEVDLLKLGPRLLIEGGPGSGKTTLLRRLAVALLAKGQRVIYIPCSHIDVSHRGLSLTQLIRKVTAPVTPRWWTMRNSAVLIDGIDEAPFDLTSRILKLPKGCENAIVSVRSAHHTELRDQYPRLELAPFTKADRDRFFRRWFARDLARLDTALRLIRKYPDVDEHTRAPLVATVVAALVERGFSPTTRNEIYNKRLELLLGTWDHARGIDRRATSNHLVLPDEKLRFVEQLAFNVQSSEHRQRTFGMAELEDAFVQSLGLRGYNLSIADFIDDLVVGSGVLVQEGSGFSFGHLTFQEHLAGRYLRREARVEEVAELLGSQWWVEALRFFAGERQHITDLIEYCETNVGMSRAHHQQLVDLANYAPYTQGVALEVLASNPNENTQPE